MDYKSNISNFLICDSRKRRATFTIEYALLIALIVAALLAMQFYVRRAMCGRLRMTGDGFGQGRQYQPGVTVITEI